jgi:hypothetical protein
VSLLLGKQGLTQQNGPSRATGSGGLLSRAPRVAKGQPSEAERKCQLEARVFSRSRHRDDERVSSEKPRESELSPTDGFRGLS